MFSLVFGRKITCYIKHEHNTKDESVFLRINLYCSDDNNDLNYPRQLVSHVVPLTEDGYVCSNGGFDDDDGDGDGDGDGGDHHLHHLVSHVVPLAELCNRATVIFSNKVPPSLFLWQR